MSESNFPALLKQHLPEIARALPKHMNGDRMARIALTEFRKNPKLGDCDPRSVFASIIVASQLGLEPGVMGQAFLVPYKKTCQLIPGWQGLVDLVGRAGRASVWTGAAFIGDDFDYTYGDRPFIRHRPAGDEESEERLQYVYAVGRVKGAEWPVIDVWGKAKILRHRDQYNKVGDKHYSYGNLEMYARKVPLLQVIKYMPKSVELAIAADLEHSANAGTQELNLRDVLEGTWSPVPDGEGADRGASASNGAPPAGAAAGSVEQPQARSQRTTSAPQREPEPMADARDDRGLVDDRALHEAAAGSAGKPIQEGQLRIVRAKLKQAGLNDLDLSAKFSVVKVEDLQFAQFDAVVAWIAERATANA